MLQVKLDSKGQSSAEIILLIGGVIAVVIVVASYITNMTATTQESFKNVLKTERENAFADIDVQLKLRFDLVDNLVETVKWYATHEKSTFKEVVENMILINQIFVILLIIILVIIIIMEKK